MSRRSLGSAAFAAALLAAGFAPLVGSASASACASWTDPAGDSTTMSMGLPETGDSNMDILAASFTTVGGNVVASVRVKDIYEGGYSDYGDQFAVQMTAGGSIVRFLALRDEFGESARVTNSAGSATGTATVVFDHIDNTITVTAAQAQVDKVVGKPSAGLEATNLAASSGNQVNGEGLMPYDTAASPKGTVYTVGAPCSPEVPLGTLPMPAADCATFTDDAADAGPIIGNSAVKAPNEPGLDIRSVAVDSTPEALRAYIKVTDLGTKPANFQGDRFEFTFKHDGKTYTISTGRTYVGKSITSYQTRGQVGGTTNAGLKVRGAFDIARDTVIVTLDRASLDTVHGSAVPDGTVVTDLAAKTLALVGAAFTTDTAQAADPAKRTYTFGDSPCFGPPPAVLTNTGKTSAQYTDGAAVAAKLASGTGSALSGKAVTFTIGGKSVTATTGTDGVAKATLPHGLTAGSYSLVTAFAGDATAAKTSLTTPFTVVQEKTKLVLKVAKSGSKRTVTAKLLDDDGRPVAGQAVTWYVNGKKVAAPKTNSSGVVTLTTAKPTQTVKAVFAAVARKYLGSTAQTKV